MQKEIIHLSETPKPFREIYEGLVNVMKAVKDGSMEVEQGEVIAKAGYGAAKLIESDLRARMFDYKISGGDMKIIENKQ